MLQAIFYLSLALTASPSADLATEVLTRADAPASAAQKLQTSSKKAEAQKAAKKKAEQKKTSSKKSTAKKAAPKTEAAKTKPVETAKTPWVMPDKKAIAAQRAKPQMTQVVKAATPAQLITPPAVQAATPQTPPVTQSGTQSVTPASQPAQSIAAFVAPAPFTPPVSPPAEAIETQTSPLNPLADILPPEVLAAAKAEAAQPETKRPESVPLPVTPPVVAPVVAATTPAAPVLKPAPVITPATTVASTPVLTAKTPDAVTPPATLSAPVASNIAPVMAQPKAVLPSAGLPTTAAKAVKVEAYNRDYEGPKSGRELQYDAGIARAFGSKVGQMGGLEGSWLVSGQDGKRLLSLELRGKTGGQVDGAWRALSGGFGLNRSGLVSDASLSESNELSLSYMERGARTPSHLKLQKSEDGRWRGTLTDGSGHSTPVIMMPDQAS
ncbi:hypothetical protein Q1W73_04155 [Asticcacaulis sp. ZE23SCel15]|uniref:hypothetical protein n=1 Tax=Asticcacaulis sp. ZE23SCel15 TaxID=3059027 RepID=UPI00265ED73F|nr:hypothetical protein [Asticcacaulis sp. ZE23SCel15]WKL58182.1 hypothetical protein Q1W73_04155 [Asticcacaulis sp. ZE23SCel15]